jgi:hypothetical protein
MITITGLTERQRQIMDLLWSCKDTEQVNTLIAALPNKQDQLDAHSLVRIAVWESIEHESGLDQYEQCAKDLISRSSRR